MSRQRSGCASQGKARTRITSVKGNYFMQQRGELSKIQEEWQSVDSNFPRQYHYKDAFLLSIEDTPEIMSEIVRFRSEVCLRNKIEWRKSLLKNGTGKAFFQFPNKCSLKQPVLENRQNSARFCSMLDGQTKMMNRLISSDLLTLLPCIM